MRLCAVALCFVRHPADGFDYNRAIGPASPAKPLTDLEILRMCLYNRKLHNPIKAAHGEAYAEIGRGIAGHGE
jgi:hypothetical protein